MAFGVELVRVDRVGGASCCWAAGSGVRVAATINNSTTAAG